MVSGKKENMILDNADLLKLGEYLEGTINTVEQAAQALNIDIEGDDDIAAGLAEVAEKDNCNWCGWWVALEETTTVHGELVCIECADD